MAARVNGHRQQLNFTSVSRVFHPPPWDKKMRDPGNEASDDSKNIPKETLAYVTEAAVTQAKETFVSLAFLSFSFNIKKSTTPAEFSLLVMTPLRFSTILQNAK